MCYTLAALPPLQTIDTCLCMGASVKHAFGIEKAKKTKKKTVAIIGDSTFIHSGITGLANVVYNRGTQTTIIVDNRITPMTGGQDHPGTSKTLMGEKTHAIDLVQLVKALGVEHVRTVDPFDQKETLAILKEEIERDAPSVVITTKPCVLFPSKLKPATKFHVVLEKCTACGACFRIGCPAISASSEKNEKGRAKSQIDFGLLGGRLSAARRQAGERLARAIEAELGDLRMERARFGVDLQSEDDPAGAYWEGRRVAFDATGLDRLEFLVAPNVGEGLKPLVKIASVGETSRLMLALKGVLARADRTPTLIFDEIDQGIGGRVGTTVGEKLWTLARRHQVLCITHLPQLAGFGDQHFKVEKRIIGDRTVTQVHALAREEIVAELAQMLGGAGEKTRAGAEELLGLLPQLER